MTLPGMETRPAPTHPLEVAAVEHVAKLRKSGTLTEAHEFQAELVLHLAARVRNVRSYALAGLSKELREALEELPKPDTGDVWDQFRAAVMGDLSCPHCGEHYLSEVASVSAS